MSLFHRKEYKWIWPPCVGGVLHNGECCLTAPALSYHQGKVVYTFSLLLYLLLRYSDTWSEGSCRNPGVLFLQRIYSLLIKRERRLQVERGGVVNQTCWSIADRFNKCRLSDLLCRIWQIFALFFPQLKACTTPALTKYWRSKCCEANLQGCGGVGDFRPSGLSHAQSLAQIMNDEVRAQTGLHICKWNACCCCERK